MSIFTEEELGKIRERIEKKIGQTETLIGELVEMTKPIAPENAIGRLSRMDAINNKSVNEAALRSAQQSLSHLQRAQARLMDADFGLCTNCGNPIQKERVFFMPESSRCVTCAAR